jgi:integrase
MKVTSTPGAANRAVSLVSAIWNWAAARDEVAFNANPAKRVVRNPETAKERFLLSDEFRRLGEALARAEPKDSRSKSMNKARTPSTRQNPENRRRLIDPYAAAAIRLLILTGARLRQILHARWGEHSISSRLKDRSEARLPWIGGAPHSHQSPASQRWPYVIAGRLRISRDQISRIHGEPSQKPLLWRGFASTIFGTLSPAWGRSISWAADYRRILGHTQPSTTARCAHLDSDPMRRAVDTIGDTISTAMNGSALPSKLAESRED